MAKPTTFDLYMFLVFKIGIALVNSGNAIGRCLLKDNDLT